MYYLIMVDANADCIRSGRDSLVKNSLLYKEYQAEREEIMRHKWIESEKAGHDIGLEHALTDWYLKHRKGWRRARQEDMEKHPRDYGLTEHFVSH
jgi:hypothetical protein